MAEAAAKRTLGRGLKSLLDEIGDDLAVERTSKPGQSRIAIEMIRPNPDQPRKTFQEDALEELSASIRAKGVIQPILVRSLPEEAGRYEIIAGERRWRAAQRAGLHEVPIIVRDLDDSEALEIAIIENVQRSDLNAIEEAIGYQQLMEKYGYTQDALAKNLGKSRSHIANIMRLTKLPERVQEMVRGGELSYGHARALISTSNPEALALKSIEKNWSVRDLESAAKDEAAIVGPTGRSSSAREKDADTLGLESEVSNALRMPVSITHKGRGGEVKITYRTLDDLDEICRRLREQATPALARA